MFKRICSILLAGALLVGLLPALTPQTQAQDDTSVASVQPFMENYDSLEEAVEDVMLAFFATEHSVDSLQDVAKLTKSGGDTTHVASEQLITFIKSQEGFLKYPKWDYEQWSVGYGTRCPGSPDTEFYDPDDVSDTFLYYLKFGMTEEEADSELQEHVSNFSSIVNDVAHDNKITLTQSQFDALVSFTYNIGKGWVYGCRLTNSLENHYHEQDGGTANSPDNTSWYLINALGTWCHVNGTTPLDGLATRRILELEMFNYGTYYNTYTDLKNSGNAHYTYLFFDGNGGTCTPPSETSDWAKTNRFYFIGSPYQSLMDASRSGYAFAGWYTKKTGGQEITAETLAALPDSNTSAGITVYAHWIPQLKNLKLSAGTLNFSPDVTEYTLTVDNEVDSITVTPVAADNSCSVYVNNQSPSIPVSLQEGENTITVRVQNADGQNTYTLHIIRSASSNPGPGEYTIRATSTFGGSISPSGTTHVSTGAAQTYTITPGNCYAIADVKVDGKSIGACSSYTFSNVTKNHTIEAVFTADLTGIYTDVPAGSWYYNAVAFATNQGMMSGVGNQLFRPEQAVTRAMVVSVLYRKAGSPSSSISNSFTDVPDGVWYTNAVYWAEENKIVAGYTDHTFRPNQSVTREEIAAFFMRYANWSGEDTSKRADLSAFTDANQISGWAQNAMQWANAEGIIHGRSDTLLAPKGTTKRSELAMMLLQMFFPET